MAHNHPTTSCASCTSCSQAPRFLARPARERGRPKRSVRRLGTALAVVVALLAGEAASARAEAPSPAPQCCITDEGEPGQREAGQPENGACETVVAAPTTTTTTTTTLPAPPTACGNRDDQAAVDGKDIRAQVTGCSYGCLVSSDIAHCVAACVKTATGLSDGCALCYGLSSQCGITNCALPCTLSQTASRCTTCLESNCIPAFNACASMPLAPPAPPAPTPAAELEDGAVTTADDVDQASPTTTTLPAPTTTTTTTLPPPSGACTNADDRAVAAKFDMKAQTSGCTVACLTAPDRAACVGACMIANTGAGPACANCYARSSECGLLHCAAPCALSQSAPPCLTCLDSQCMPAFDRCTGLGAPPPTASCSNGGRDGSESDVDCGGSCSRCAIGRSCSVAGDCVSLECVHGQCSPPTKAIPFGSCVGGYIDPSSDADAVDFGAAGGGADDGYRVTLASATDVYVQLINQDGSTATMQTTLLASAGDVATAVAGLATGEVRPGQNGAAGPVAVAAGSYSLYVDTAAASTFGAYSLCVLPAPTIALDSCVSTAVGNGDGNNITLAGAGGDKGLRFTPPADANVIVQLRNLSGASTVAAGIYRGTALVDGSSTGPTPLFTERHTGLIAVTGAVPYTVQVDTADADSFGNFEVCVKEAGCGDGIVSGGEACDDGNKSDGDGCSAVCQLEAGALVVDSCRSDHIPLFGKDCHEWTVPIARDQDVYLEVINPLGATLLAKGSIRSGSTPLVKTGNIRVAQRGSTSVTSLSAAHTYTARVCDVTGAGFGDYTVCLRPARSLELGDCYAGNVSDGDGDVVELAGPSSGGDEDVLLRPPRDATVRLTLSHRGGGAMIGAGVYDGRPGTLLAGSAVGHSPSPLATGSDGSSGLFSVNGGQLYRIYTDIASLGTTGADYEICVAEVAGHSCRNPADELARSSFNLGTEAGASGLSCRGNAVCIAGAVHKKTGLSRSCSACYGGIGSCAASHCALVCLSDSGSSDCRSCVASNCAQEFEVCSGWTYQQ